MTRKASSGAAAVDGDIREGADLSTSLSVPRASPSMERSCCRESGRTNMIAVNDPRRSEWLETDGLGGYSMGTVSGPRTRRYHGLLVAAASPPVGRFVLVAGMDVAIQTPQGRWSLSAQRYFPDVIDGEGERFIETFSGEPWPTWTFRLPDGTRVEHQLFERHGMGRVFLSWRLLGASPGPVTLTVRPLLACRPFHSLLQETSAFSFAAERREERVGFRPFANGPGVSIVSNGSYAHQPYWYRRFLYAEELARGLDHEEDLGSPGVWSFSVESMEAVLILAADESAPPASALAESARERERERNRRTMFATPLDRAADQYMVARGEGRSIIAGYPWFGDWGRDTFISLRGLCLARGRTDQAIAVLSTWAGLLSQGMLPNYFPDALDEPTYNSVDASLWFVVTVAEALAAAGQALDTTTRRRLIDAAEAILDGYARGTRFGIAAASDGLLAAGVPGEQLTWMDARVAGREITPRIGKPVEVQALWLNALALAARWATPSAARWMTAFTQGVASFASRFWNTQRGCLFDVVDVEHRAGVTDQTFRPNQILAVGGLPLSLLDGVRARAVVDAVEARLVTPLGLRSLAPGEVGYAAHYGGDVAARDAAYHQGTAWAWLMGPFVEAYIRVRGDSAAARAEARARFLLPLMDHLGDVGLGHVSEVSDAEFPFRAGGCPFQAWSLAELIRLDRVVLAQPEHR